MYKGFGALVLQYALHVAVLKITRVGFDLMAPASAVNVPAATQRAGPYDVPHRHIPSHLRSEYHTGPGNPM